MSFPFAFLFGTPLLAGAAAAGAIAVPIVIHLLNRRRYRVVVWAAMRFLLNAEKKNARRLRLEQLLLLGVRTLLVLLLVLAMASVTPWAEAAWHRLFPESLALAGPGSQRTHRILVLDGSFSMATRVGDGTYFERARRIARQMVDEAPRGDGFSVVLMASPPRRVVGEASEDARKVARELDAVRLPQGNGDLQAALATVDDLLRHSPPKFDDREVTFLTDLQQSTWVSRQPAGVAALWQKVQTRARTVLLDVGSAGVSNTAVTDLTLGNGLVGTTGVTAFKATVHHYGNEARDNVHVELWVGKGRVTEADPPLELRQAYQETRKLARGANQVTLPYRFTSPGDYVVQVRIDGDALDLDDTRTVVVRVRDSVPVLLVNGKPTKEPFDNAAEWLRLALNPFEGRPAPGFVAARPKVISTSEFADTRAGDPSPYDCVFLCGVPEISPAEVRRLETHVRSGGGLVICPGERMDRTSLNDLLYHNGEGLLPARLLGRVDDPSPHHFQFALDDSKDLEAPLDAFTDARDRDSIREPRFTAYERTQPAPHGGPRKVLAFAPVPNRAASPADVEKFKRLPNGDAAIWEWQPPLGAKAEHGPGPGKARGHVVLITTTLNSDWGNWPATRGYLPLMQELLPYAIGGRSREQAVTVGDFLEEYLPNLPAAVDALVLTPDNRKEATRTQTHDDAGVFRWADTDVSGPYRVVLGADPRELLFAVNVPAVGEGQAAGESDPARTDLDELRRTYPEGEFQVVTDPHAVDRSGGPNGGGEPTLRPLGPGIAHWMLLGMLALALVEVILAWRFGHHSAVAGEAVRAAPSRAVGWLLAVVPVLLFVVVTALVGVLAHYAWTGDFLGFLPEALRRGFERALDIPAPAAGEGSRWRLEFLPYLWDSQADPWLAGLLGLGAVLLLIAVYRREGATTTSGQKAVLAGLRGAFLLLTLLVLLPQLRLWFEREAWPDVVILVDDSQSMSTSDKYQDDRVQAAATQLAQTTGLTAPDRLRLVQALVSGGEEGGWVATLLSQKRVKVHVYHCSARAGRLADVTTTGDVPNAVRAITDLRADARNDSSQLGASLHQVLNDFRGASLSAVIMLTDGVTTEGEDLGKASKQAAQMGVPLYLVGLGESHEARDLRLHDLQVEETVYVNDTLVFEARLAGPGFPGLHVPVRLREKDSEKVLDTQDVTVEPDGRSVKVRLTHKPTKAGEKIYVVEVPQQPGEAQTDNNTLERAVSVRESKLIKVLYVEGYPRYEFRFVKTLLERESARARGNKSVELKVYLVDADSRWASQDKSALSQFPSKAELNQYDVVILGDVDPKADARMREDMRNLADFVRERGGGLLMIAGPRYAPYAYKDTPLKDVLPVDLVADPPAEPPEGIVEGFRPELTPVGRMHPIFRFSPDEQESDAIWAKLKEVFWFAQGYQPKRAVEILAVHPRVKATGARANATPGHPLVLQQFVGAGRCMFFGFDETWRWQFREDKLHFNQFWVQVVRYLAHSRVGKTELRLDRQTPYRRGEPIKVTVRFPDDAPPPGPEVAVKVVVERQLLRNGLPAEGEVQSMQLARVEGSRATYEGTLTRTPEGDYRFWLSEPVQTGEKPRAEAKVLAPPGEMDNLRMNQADLERAAEQSHGRFYTLADAAGVPDDLPSGVRVSLNAPGPPMLLWNHVLLFTLALLLVSTEWVLRKRRHLL